MITRKVIKQQITCLIMGTQEMNNFKPNKLMLAMLSSGLIALGTSSLIAEEADDEEEKAEEENTITITGFRGSIIESINTKRYSTSVVESISAEDIGKLPDSSIAESIARLPGIAAQRLDGRASRVTIRGFGENESGTTFNGREQVSISDNRGVEFDLYPSEIMSGVTVYKTPDASIDGEGIAGVIDLQTISPLTQDERVMQINGQYEMTSLEKLNPDGHDSGFRGTFTFVDKFADDKLGVAFAYSMMESPNQEERWNAWGYPNFGVDGTDYYILGGAKPFVRSSLLDRDTVMLVVEAAPTENLKVTFDALNVNFLDEKRLRGIEIPFAWGQGAVSANTVESNGFISSATTTGQRVVVRNDYETREADLTNFGFNVEYTVSEDLNLEFDMSSSKVEREIYSLESYSGTGRGSDRGVADTLTYTMGAGNAGATFAHGLNYADYNLIQLGGPQSWGWSSALNDSLGITGTEYENQAQDGFLNTPTIDDELSSLRFAAEQALDGDVISSLTYGVYYREREKNKSSDGFFMTLSAFSYPDNPGMQMVPSEYQLGTVSLDFLGMGNMIAYDPMALIANGYYTFLSESLTSTSHLTQSWNVKEETTSLFVKADINTEVGGMPLTGNFGVRYTQTDQSSAGFAGNLNGNGRIVVSPISNSHDYSHVLPSLNLALQMDDSQILRFGIAETISRPRMDEMNSNVSINYNQQPDNNGNYWSVNGGNTKLEPKEALGIDLTYENYFSNEGYFSVAYFYKDLEQWIFDGNYFLDLPGVVDPNTGLVPPTSGATGSGKINAGGGDLSGYEVSLSMPLSEFTDSLEGFGVVLSHTGLSSNIKIPGTDNDFQLPGLSDSISTFTMYYDLNGFSARASMRKRDDFKGDVYGLGFSTNQVDILGETIWDAQIGYDFGQAGVEGWEGLSVFLQAQNLTNEPFTSYVNGDPLQVRDYQNYGKYYLLGFSYKL